MVAKKKSPAQQAAERNQRANFRDGDYNTLRRHYIDIAKHLNPRDAMKLASITKDFYHSGVTGYEKAVLEERHHASWELAETFARAVLRKAGRDPATLKYSDDPDAPAIEIPYMHKAPRLCRMRIKMEPSNATFPRDLDDEIMLTNPFNLYREFKAGEFCPFPDNGVLAEPRSILIASVYIMPNNGELCLEIYHAINFLPDPVRARDLLTLLGLVRLSTFRAQRYKQEDGEMYIESVDVPGSDLKPRGPIQNITIISTEDEEWTPLPFEETVRYKRNKKTGSFYQKLLRAAGTFRKKLKK